MKTPSLHHLLAGFLTLAASVASAEEAPRAPTAMEIYSANYQGRILYGEEKYAEAYPLLMLAAQHGLKTAQAQIGILHLNGLGGAQKDPAMIVGWLGTASDGYTDRKFKQSFEEVWDQLPENLRPRMERIKQAFIEHYGADAHGVKCSRKKHFRSTVAKFECFFDDDRYGETIDNPYYAISLGEGELDERAIRTLRGLENDGIGGATTN